MPAKRKKLTPSKKKLPSRSVKVLAPPVTGSSFFATAWDRLSPHWTKILLGASVLLWLASKWGVFPKAGTVFFLVGLFLLASFYSKALNQKVVLLLVGVGWILVDLCVGNNPNFKYVFAGWSNFDLYATPIAFAIGVGLLVGFWKSLPPADPSQDISRGWARLWFWVIFAVAAYFRMRNLHEAVGCYWDDMAVTITDPRGIMEFHETPLLMPIANREPLYPYFFAGLWSLMPDAYAIFVQRLGSGLMDLVAVWLFYLLGKEVGGRRVGLVAAALAAVSKPLLIADITGASNVTAPLAVSLLLLMTFRLFKKPDWKHFVYWGLALGFLPYSYTSVRPFLLFILTAVLVWIWFYKQKEGKAKADLSLGWGTWAAWVFTFLVIHHFLPTASPWVVFLTKGWVALAVLAVLMALCYTSLRSERPSGVPALVPRFFIGVLLATAILYPLASNPLIGVHVAGFSIFNNHADLSVHVGLDSIKLFLNKIGDTLHTMFVSGEDRGDMNLNLDAFFDYHFIPVLVLGLAAVLTQPNWIRVFLLVGGFVGISPHILSIDGHSGRLVCGLVPLAILAGLGVEQFYQALKTAMPRLRIVYFAVPVMAAYFGWAAWASYEKVWNTFFTGDRVEKTISNQVKSFAGRARVFTAPYPLFVSSVTQAVLDQGYDLYSLGASNLIPVREGEKPKDVVVLYHLYDKDTAARIQKEYKNVAWDTVYLAGWPDKRIASLRAIIPAAEISDKPGSMFYFQRVPATDWIRDYLINRNILGYGVIELEESVADPYSPIPSNMGGRMVNLRASFELPKESSLKFKVITNDYVKFQVDGRKILYLAPDWTPQTTEKTVEVGAGKHWIDYDIWLQHEQTIPRMTVSVDGASPVVLSTLTQSVPPVSTP